MHRSEIPDVLQETAVRALAARTDFGSLDELTRWAFTVAWRQCIDNGRRRGRTVFVPMQALSDHCSDAEVSRTVEGRIEVDRTLRAMASLSTLDREALAKAVSGVGADGADSADSAPVDRRQAVREAVRLHRARTRLVQAMGKLAGLGGTWWRSLRRPFGLEMVSAGAAAAAAALTVTVLTLGPRSTVPEAVALPLPPAPAVPARAAAAPIAEAGPVGGLPMARPAVATVSKAPASPKGGLEIVPPYPPPKRPPLNPYGPVNRPETRDRIVDSVPVVGGGGVAGIASQKMYVSFVRL